MKKLKVLLCSMLIGSTVFATPIMAAENTVTNAEASTRATSYYASGMVESSNGTFASDSLYCSAGVYSPTVRVDFSSPYGGTITLRIKDPYGNYVTFNNGLDYVTGANGNTKYLTIYRSIKGYYTLEMRTTSSNISRATVNIYK